MSRLRPPADAGIAVADNRGPALRFRHVPIGYAPERPGVASCTTRVGQNCHGSKPLVRRAESARELETLEAVQRLFDAPLVQSARGLAEPGPLLEQQLLPCAVGLEIEQRHDFVPDEHGECEVAEPPLLLGDVSLEAVLVVEE